jgi:uncharacterized protein (DUF362 family)
MLLVFGLCSLHAQALRIDPVTGEKLPDAAPADAKSRVFMVENPALVSQFQVNESAAQDAFNRALMAYTGTSSVKDAWLSLVSPGDTVGLKIASSGGTVMGQHRPVVQAIISGLLQAGIPASNIILWDKFDYSLKGAGYAPDTTTTGGWQVRSAIPGAGFDPKVFYFNEVVGQLIWGDSEFKGKKQFDIKSLYAAAEAKTPDPAAAGTAGGNTGGSGSNGGGSSQISNRSYITKLVTQDTTKLINIASMTDHAEVGIAGCLSSLALSSVDNSRRFTAQGVYGDPAIAEILTNDAFADKVVLNVMDGLIIQFAGGPNFAPLYADSAGILMLSKDPVAIDSLVLERIERRRAERQVVPIGDAARHIATCARMGLGTNKPEKIEVIPIQ